MIIAHRQMKYLVIAFFFLAGIVAGQDYTRSSETATTYYLIDSIAITGNYITEPYIILEELTFKSGDRINAEEMKFNRERIYSLGLFTRVELIPTQKDSTTDITIRVEESWYIWPIPFIDFKDNDYEKIVFGMDITVNNFRGRNELLGFRFGAGYDTELKFRYNIPYLFKKEKISFLGELSYNKSVNKSQIAESIVGKEFEQKTVVAQIAIGKRLDLFDYITTFVGFQFIETPEYIPRISLREGERIDRVYYIGLQYLYDSRDLAQFPLQGRWGLLNFVTKGLDIDGVSYNILHMDYKEFLPLWGDLNSKWRIAGRHAFGKVIPFYEYSFLGYSDRVRGHYYKKDEGHTLFISSLELRHPIVKEWNIELDLPLIPSQLLTYRVAVFAQLFADAGFTKFRNEGIKLKDLRKGWGLGLTFLVLPYNLGRIEVAFDEDFKSQFILDIGVSF